jgi:hypothetical protein
MSTSLVFGAVGLRRSAARVAQDPEDRRLPLSFYSLQEDERLFSKTDCKRGVLLNYQAYDTRDRSDYAKDLSDGDPLGRLRGSHLPQLPPLRQQ